MLAGYIKLFARAAIQLGLVSKEQLSGHLVKANRALGRRLVDAGILDWAGVERVYREMRRVEERRQPQGRSHAMEAAIGQLAVERGQLAPSVLERALEEWTRQVADGVPRSLLDQLRESGAIHDEGIATVCGAFADAFLCCGVCGTPCSRSGLAPGTECSACGWPVDLPLPDLSERARVEAADPMAGRQLGRSVLKKKLGQGGMGQVYVAHHLGLDVSVAVKLLSPTLGAEQEWRERFLREARVAARIDHPSVVRVFDVDHQDDQYFIVMELVRGQSLGDVLLEQGRLAPVRALGIVRDAAQGLEVAHRAGLVHRDIKPDNLMLTDQGQVKVADFGLARDVVGSRLSVSGQIMGSPPFMSPEQANGLECGPQSDVFSLGVTLYALLAGSSPFARATILGTIHAVADEPLPRLVVPDLPPGTTSLLEWMCAKTPTARPASMAEVTVAIDHVLRGEALPAIAAAAVAPGVGVQAARAGATRAAATAPTRPAAMGARAPRPPSGGLSATKAASMARLPDRVAIAARARATPRTAFVLLTIVGLIALAAWSPWRSDELPPTDERHVAPPIAHGPTSPPGGSGSTTPVSATGGTSGSDTGHEAVATRRAAAQATELAAVRAAVERTTAFADRLALVQAFLAQDPLPAYADEARRLLASINSEELGRARRELREDVRGLIAAHEYDRAMAIVDAFSARVVAFASAAAAEETRALERSAVIAGALAELRHRGAQSLDDVARASDLQAFDRARDAIAALPTWGLADVAVERDAWLDRVARDQERFVAAQRAAVDAAWEQALADAHLCVTTRRFHEARGAWYLILDDARFVAHRAAQPADRRWIEIGLVGLVEEEWRDELVVRAGRQDVVTLPIQGGAPLRDVKLLAFDHDTDQLRIGLRAGETTMNARNLGWTVKVAWARGHLGQEDPDRALGIYLTLAGEADLARPLLLAARAAGHADVARYLVGEDAPDVSGSGSEAGSGSGAPERGPLVLSPELRRFIRDRDAERDPVRQRRMVVEMLRRVNALDRINTLDEANDIAEGRLVRLNVNQNPDLHDITPLAGMALVGLDLGGTRVADLRPLAGMPLVDLGLYRNPAVRDLTPLAGNRQLRYLGLDRCDALTDLRGLETCDADALHLDFSPVTDLTPITHMTRLTNLSFSGCPVRDFEPLAPLLGRLNEAYALPVMLVLGRLTPEEFLAQSRDRFASDDGERWRWQSAPGYVGWMYERDRRWRDAEAQYREVIVRFGGDEGDLPPMMRARLEALARQR